MRRAEHSPWCAASPLEPWLEQRGPSHETTSHIDLKSQPASECNLQVVIRWSPSRDQSGRSFHRRLLRPWHPAATAAHHGHTAGREEHQGRGGARG